MKKLSLMALLLLVACETHVKPGESEMSFTHPTTCVCEECPAPTPQACEPPACEVCETCPPGLEEGPWSGHIVCDNLIVWQGKARGLTVLDGTIFLLDEDSVLTQWTNCFAEMERI